MPRIASPKIEYRPSKRVWVVTLNGKKIDECAVLEGCQAFVKGWENARAEREAAKPNITFDVRQVSRGFWTYDLYFHDEGCRAEYSVGECFSRRDAETSARHTIRDYQNEHAA